MSPRNPPIANLRVPIEQALNSDYFSWQAILMRNRNGVILPNLANAMTALTLSPEWKDVLAFDEFKMRVVAKTTTPWHEKPDIWDDDADILTCRWLQEQGINVEKRVAGQAVQAIAKTRRVHPVRAYLQGLKWDGEPRIDRWMADYLGAPSSSYVDAVSAKWLISGVARILRPGSKVDTMLVLEGRQGTGKSTALRIIARQDEWFTDQLDDMGTKESMQQLAGRWIVEVSELAAMHRASIEKLKAFLSRDSDKYRPPYGTHVTSAYRQCIFAGSTNATEYLMDETGARRFWPVRCRDIHLPELERDIDQLWAEAVHRFNAGEEWWLSGAAEQQAESEASHRYVCDPWTELIEAFISIRDTVSVEEILQDCIQKARDQRAQGDQNRVVRVLKSLSWEHYRQRIGTRVTRRYRPVNVHNIDTVHAEADENTYE